MLSAAILIALVPLVAGHGAVTSYTIAGVTYPGVAGFNSLSGQTSIERPWTSYNPILSATDPNIACNYAGGGSLSSAGGTQLSATVAAGTAVTSHWLQWTHLPGPSSVYMASCGGPCTAAVPASLNWFKIKADGLLSGSVYDGTWGNGEVEATLAFTATIPASLAPGEYLYRNELLAIHTANQPQFYAECAQLIVTGSGTGVPSGSYVGKLPGMYSPSDPSIDIDIYDSSEQTNFVYVVPGPPVWPSGTVTTTTAGSAPTTAAPTTSSSKPVTTTVVTTSSKPPVTTTTSASGATQTKYGQCGGIGWTGATSCVAGSTCTASGAYYSQCT